jgi:hypothetical protein
VWTSSPEISVSFFLGEYLAKRKTEFFFFGNLHFFSVDSRKNANFFGENLPNFRNHKTERKGKKKKKKTNNKNFLTEVGKVGF